MYSFHAQHIVCSWIVETSRFLLKHTVSHIINYSQSACTIYCQLHDPRLVISMCINIQSSWLDHHRVQWWLKSWVVATFSFRLLWLMMTSLNGIISVLLALCEGKPLQRPVTRSFGAFFDLRLNKRLSKQSRRRWFETPLRSLWRHHNGFHNISIDRMTSSILTDEI